MPLHGLFFRVPFGKHKNMWYGMVVRRKRIRIAKAKGTSSKHTENIRKLNPKIEMLKNASKFFSEQTEFALTHMVSLPTGCLSSR